MPITPNQAASKSNALVQGLVAAHEQVFDAQLAAEYAGCGRVIVAGSKCPSIPMHVRDKTVRELKGRYLAAGWILERHDDQREGISWIIRVDVKGSPRDGGYGAYSQSALDDHGR